MSQPGGARVEGAELAPMDVAARADRVRAVLGDNGVDALAVTALANVRWLTGFTGSNAVVLVRADRVMLFTDGRYADQAPQQVEAAGVAAEVVIASDLFAAMAAAATDSPRLGLEADAISWAEQQAISDARSSGELVATNGLILRERAIKDSGELDRMRTAARITDATLATVVPMLAERPTERDVSLALDHGLRLRGATSSAYETIVASGPNGALPHARPGDRVIGEGDLVVIDVGALVDGYRSDMTRTFVVGSPDETQQRQLEVVREAQALGVAAVGPDVEARAVDAACRDHIVAAGWGAAFTHGAGHGVGLDIHELPRVNSRTDDVLREGMLVTVEPGVYLAGRGGVRWEDLLVVTADGATPITASPKEPIVRALT